MYFECKECGKLVDDGCYDNKICASCILNSVDESRSENRKGQNAQYVVSDGACCDMCGIADTKLYYYPVGVMPMFLCGNCSAIMLM